MNILKNGIVNLAELVLSLKTKHLHWQETHLETKLRLKQSTILAEKELEATLKKKMVQLSHEISLLKTQNNAELSMLKIKCQQDINDYKHYLDALGQLKKSIQRSYPHLPEAVAFTIHHHAKQLLNRLWEATDFEEKMHYELQLITFMTTVHEDARLYLEGSNTEKLPEKTLHLIKIGIGAESSSPVPQGLIDISGI